MGRSSLAAALAAVGVEQGLDQPARAMLALALPPSLDSEAATAIVETARIASEVRLTLPSPVVVGGL